MALIDTGFAALLGAHTLDELDREPGSVVGLWPDGRIALLNGAWQRFAEQNQGIDALRRWPIGADLLSGISGVLRDYYTRAFASVREQCQPWEQTYQCHSPLVRRQFRLRALPLEQRALLLVHSTIVEAPFAGSEPDAGSTVAAPDLEEYVGPNGMVRQCSNCRRTQHGTSGSWDWVRSYVTQAPSNVSHGICNTCLRQDYPDLR
ncbi:MAG TPA: hypothetical protein VMG12_02105 [Polyangiaceae bacterium]|nr:hypothetical protein [Polyangiaceae bacterium]